MQDTTLRRLKAASTTIVGSALAMAIVWPAAAADVSKARLENANAEPHNWLMGFQNYDSHRFSRLNQINKTNVANLKAIFHLPVPTGLIGRTAVQFQNYVLVDDGFGYFDDGAATFYKVDLRSGTKATILWKTDAALAKDLTARSRGIAMMGNAIYHNLPDGRVVAVSRDSGEFLWDKQIAKVANAKAQTEVGLDRETFTAAPIAVGDGNRLLVGNSGGDAGSRGWVAAVNAANGTETWRTYMIPGPGEMGHETWKDTTGAWKTGGAGMWTTGSYDVGQRLTIWGTGQPQPMHDPEARPGDNLFSNSAVAMEIDTGKIKWFFQYTANESWDYDEQGVHMLYDVNIGGTMRKVVGHFARNGFYYNLDRTNGQFINSGQYVAQVTWTAGIDPKTGKPVEYNPALAVQTYIPATRTLRGDRNDMPACPHRLGGVRWQPQAYNPQKRLAYSGGWDGCFTYEVEPTRQLPGGGLDREGPGGMFGIKNQKNFDLHGLLAAVDVTTGQVVAKHRQPYGNQSGVLATAGGLIFSGTTDGAITAHDDETLAEVWRFETGIHIKAAPTSYSVNGRQFIAIMAAGQAPGGANWPELAQQTIGASLFVFGL
jgi:alcohol dehydrogenase (cytochrome c)